VTRIQLNPEAVPLPEEIEAKVAVADPEAFRRLMAARGLAAGPTVFEVNRLFDDASASLRRAGSALRVREERDLAGGRVLRTLLTFKGPRRPGPLKRRDEFELSVEAAEPLVDILGRLGLALSFTYEKRRTTWRAGECEVTLDELPHLGWFAEVEGPTADAVHACLADLGLAGLPLIADSYVSLLFHRLESLGRDPTLAVF
jgi:adenylate cyclase, class 2